MFQGTENQGQMDGVTKLRLSYHREGNGVSFLRQRKLKLAAARGPAPFRGLGLRVPKTVQGFRADCPQAFAALPPPAAVPEDTAKHSEACPGVPNRGP